VREASSNNVLIEFIIDATETVIRTIPGTSVKHYIYRKIHRRLLKRRPREVIGSTWFGHKMHLQIPDAVQLNIYLTGYWEPSLTDFIAKALVPGDIFIDIGANVGYYTLLGSKLVGDTGKIYAFEASPRIAEQLKRNISLNSLTNIHISRVAVSNRSGSVLIWSGPSGNAGRSTIMGNVAEVGRHSPESEIDCEPLLNLVTESDLFSARLIKIDVEGAERLVIEGISPVLDRFSARTEWIIEIAPSYLPGGTNDATWIYDTFESSGYNAYKIYNSYQNMLKDSWNRRALQVSPMPIPPANGVHDILFTKNKYD
jgi:FkbM family methyltransferase